MIGINYRNLVILCIMITIMNSGCCCVSPENLDQIEKSRLTLIDSNIETGEYSMWYIVGTVKNNTNNQISYVQISFNLYDKAGNQVGTAFSNTTNLEPLGTWKFKAIPSVENVCTYKLKELIGY